jgi:RAB protein geranylgeranyltransferase component A
LNKSLIENNNISLLEKNSAKKNFKFANEYNNDNTFMEKTSIEKNVNYGNLQDLVRGIFLNFNLHKI